MKHYHERSALLLLLVFCPFFYLSAVAGIQGVELDEPVTMPEFSLQNENGDLFTHVDLQEKWTLMMFGFMSCPDVCPFTMKNLEVSYSEIAMRVKPESLPQVVIVSVDPQRDADVVGGYARFFHPEFAGYTGDREAIDALIETTDSFYKLMPPDNTGFYDVQHSASVSIIDPDGQLVAKLQPPFDPAITAEFLSRLQIQYRRSKSQL